MEKPQEIFQEKSLKNFLAVEIISGEKGRIGFVCTSLEDLKNQVAKKFDLAPPIRIFSYEGDREITDKEQFSQLECDTFLVAAASDTEDLEKKVLLEERRRLQMYDLFPYSRPRYFGEQYSQRNDEINQEEISQKDKEFKLTKSTIKFLYDIGSRNGPIGFNEKKLNKYASEIIKRNAANEKCPIEKNK